MPGPSTPSAGRTSTTRPTAVEALIDAVGLRPVYLGDDQADTLDGLLPVWFTLSKLRGRHLAFKVLEDPAGT
jgi:hypothetical protein